MDKFSFAELKKFLTPAVYAGLAIMAFGVIYFLSQWEYSENHHGTLLITWCVLAVLFSVTIHFYRYGLSVLIILMLLGAVTYAQMKFNWREAFITAASKNKYPAINRYIDHYPTFEEHSFAALTGEPRWIEFSKECLEPALDGKPMAESCHSVKMIEDRYNIDINSVINEHYAKMRKTAIMLQKGQLNNEAIYRSCLQSKRCAFIPLLPANADIDTMSAQSGQYMDIRRQFWSIIDNKMIQDDACDFDDLCRIMRDNNVIVLKPAKTDK